MQGRGTSGLIGQEADKGLPADFAAHAKDDAATDAAVLPEPTFLAREAMGELEAALEELRGILEELGDEIEEAEL